MKNTVVRNLIVLIITIALCRIGYADNPLIQTKYTADPAPMVYKDTVYLYTSHDEDDAGGFTMYNWMLYTTTDMVNWTDHGIIGGVKEPYRTFKWSDGNNAWAPQCIQRNGKFYIYCPFPYKGQMAIGVAVADSPFGPFKDPLGKPLVVGSYDPTVYIDDDGQAYLYWGGNGPAYYVKLNEDMISTSGEIVQVVPDLEHYCEGPWFWKKNGHYYLAFASTCCPEGIGYAMSPGPTGPWKTAGYIMDPNPRSSGNHPGIIDYKGNSYVFGFNYEVLFARQSQHVERRSICVARMTYNPDGTIVNVPWWNKEGVPQIGALDPYKRTEAETICWAWDVKTEPCSAGGMDVCNIDNGDYIKVKGVNFGAGASAFTANVASASAGGTIELHLDSVGGKSIGSVYAPFTGGWQNWKNVSTNVSGAKGIHDLYLVFKGNGSEHLFNFDYWKFGKADTKHNLAAVTASVDYYKIDTAAGRNSSHLRVTAIYSDGSTSDVTKYASIKSANGCVKLNGSLVTGNAYGAATIRASYAGKSDKVSMVVKDLKAEGSIKRITVEPDISRMYTANKRSFTVTAEYYDEHTENITTKANYANTDPATATIEKGTIIAKQAGNTKLTVSYKGTYGDTIAVNVDLIVSNRDPYSQNKASSFTAQSGIDLENCSEGQQDVAFIDDGDWVKYDSVDYGNGAKSFEARVASAGSGGDIQIILDSLNGPVAGTCHVDVTGNWQGWVTKTCPVTGIEGKHDVYLKFTGKGGSLFNINWWKFLASN